MKTTIVAAIVGLLALLMLTLNSGAVQVDVYANYLADGGGAPYGDLVGSFTSTDIMFATNTGYAWHPFGLSDFGADITGFFSVVADGSYTFTLNSDDGSLLFINGALVVNNGGVHAPSVVSGTTLLNAGTVPFEVQFFEDFGGPSGVDLTLPDGITYSSTAVPEPATILLLGAGLAGLGFARKRFKS